MKNMQKSLVVVGFLFVVGLIVVFISISTAKHTLQSGALISPQEVKHAIDAQEKITIVDVRTPEEYKQGHVKNSILLPLDTIGTKAPEALPDKNQTVYVYCQTGHRSAQAVSALQQMGYTHVYSMEGGLTAWQNAGYPIVK